MNLWLVHEQVVDAHELEVHDVVFAVLDVESECLDFGFEVRLAFLYAFEHTVGNVFALLGEDFEVLFYAVQFLLQDLFLYLRGLGDHAELFVRQDDGVPIVVLHLTHDADTVFGGEIFFAGIEDTGIGIGGLEGLGYLVDIGFQTDNHRFVCQSQTLHFVGGGTHNQGFAAAYFVVNDATAVDFGHPDGIFLTAVEVRDAQCFEVKVGKGLHGAVVLGFDGVVELAVVHVGEPLFELRGLFFQPIAEAVADFVYLAIGKLDGFGVADFDYIVAYQYFFGDVGRGVLNGVFHQVESVVTAALGLDAILFADADVATGGCADAELVAAGGVGNLDVGIEKTGGVFLVDAHWYPAFAEIEVEFFKRDGYGKGGTQGIERL